MEETVEVPSYFLCPITLDIMRDPVTLPTGITYDRHAIHRWLQLAGGATSATCPLTKLPVAPDCEPTPNHTLRRLIDSWCALHHPDGLEKRVDTMTTTSTADRALLDALFSRLAHVKRLERETLAALHEIRDVVAEGERGRDLVAALPGAVDALFTVLVNTPTPASTDAALDVISSLRLSERCLVRAVDRDGMALVHALVSTLGRSDSDAASRARAAVLLADVTAAMAPSRAASLPEQVFVEAVRLLSDEDGGASAQKTSAPATKAALRVLAGPTSHGRNQIKAAEAGAVAALVDVLLVERRRAWCELALCALDRLCGCAEGRAALVGHVAGIAAVGEKVAVTSAAASGKAVRVLRSVARHAATGEVVREMATTGAVSKLCVVAVSPETPERTRERARETLRMHAAAWRSSPCLHPNLQALYPC